tara:strand:+ start:471 stop:737 length:267 start_codon:yes stop_codon:yes gene_type:complete
MSELSQTLKEWNNVKQQLKLYKKKDDEYRLKILKEMNRLNKNRISAGGYTVSRSRTSRETLSKNNIPSDLWKQYCTKYSYDVYRLVHK